MNDRKVKVKFNKEHNTFDCCLVGEAKFEGNRELSLSSYTPKEAIDLSIALIEILKEKVDLSESLRREMRTLHSRLCSILFPASTTTG